jgi:uncharacterized protein YndB with AHSA1/START domain
MKSVATPQTTVVHSTFSIEKSYPAPPSRVFRAFSDPATKRRWFHEGEGFEVLEWSLDYRAGGRELSRFTMPGMGEFRNDTVYQDIVADRRIVFAYTMSTPTHTFSASLATVELVADGEGTRLVFTEQAAFFEGADGPTIREEGWRSLLTALGAEFRS